MSEAPPGTALSEPDAVAVDHATGQVFVADPGSGVVDVFAPSGAYEAQFGEDLSPVAVAVDEASGDVYVADAFENDILVFRPDRVGGYEMLSVWSGAAVAGGEFGEVAGVAVDNSPSVGDPSAGDVLVVDRESRAEGAEGGAVDVFKPRAGGPEEAAEGELVRVLSGVKLVEPNAVAVDAASGREYVADSPVGAVYEFSTSGVYEKVKLTGSGSPQGSFRGKEEEEGNVTGLALDEGTGDLLIAEGERGVVSEFDPAGEWVGWITQTPAGRLGEPRGVAISVTGDVYVDDGTRGVVDVFGAGVAVADVASKNASKLTRTTAILNGAVDGEGKPVRYHFEWGTGEAYGSNTPVAEGTGGVEEKATADLGELQAGTTYYFRLVGEDEDGTSVGAELSFTTAAAVEGIATGSVEALTPTAATLTGSLTPGGVEASYYFEWGTSSNYGSTTTVTSAGAGGEAVKAEAPLSDLSANTTYFYRLVAHNRFGTTVGEGAKFTTPGPPRITTEPTSGIGHETATLKAKVDPDERSSEYHFEYGETTAYGTEVPVGGGKLTAGETPVAVSAALTGLKLGVTYHVRVVATNEAGTTVGPDQRFTTIPPALIESESAAEVTATGATLQTQVNPLGNNTTDYFQYGPENCAADPGACTDAPTPPGTDIGGSESGQPGSLHLEELKPDTAYYYRVFATNKLGTAEGTLHSFNTQPQAEPFALADNRAWEMVSPPNKHGAPIEALTREGGLILASEDGRELTYVANGAVIEEPEGNRSPEMQQVISTRGASGWSSQDIATPNRRAQGVSPGSAPEYQFFTPSLSGALVEPWGTTPFSEPPLAPEAKQKTMYIRNNESGTYLPLVTEANVPVGVKFGDQLHFISATPDLGHMILRSEVALTPQPSGRGLYEWYSGALQFVSLLPSQTPANEAELGFDGHVLARAISSNGSRVIWTRKEEGSGAGHLYMRDIENSQTIQLDAAQGAPEPEKGSAQFQTASSDGSKVLFTDKQRLTADSTAEPGGAGQADLYECELAEENGERVCHLKDLTVDYNEHQHAGVRGLVFGASEDGASVYFVAQGVLVGDENDNGEVAEEGKNNLYYLHYDGTQWTRMFVAALSGEDKAEWEGGEHANTAYLTARVSPNGRYLAFMSAASPTGYDNVDENSGKRDEEVYLYDSSEGRLTCVSCDPTGARPTGVLDTSESGEGLGLLVDRRRVWEGHWLAGNIPGWTSQSLTSALFQSRYLSDEGRLFFNSPDDLVPQAANHKEDVYEYEPARIGSCNSESGCVSLMSSGNSGEESAFMEATPSGSNVFFLTAARLLPQDTDTAFDIYDARVCTQASPCLTPPSSTPAGCDAADACRPVSSPEPTVVGPSGTAAVSASGSPAAPPEQADKSYKVKGAVLTQRQKLKNALTRCKKNRKKKRTACERKARKAYSAKTAAKTPSARSARKERR